ncbi:hypothetical protein G9A89_009157 [Geosiphon pyriformis]|nr:hypothetical protein G9A89_009157 [Geosiphon pyriformis]
MSSIAIIIMGEVGLKINANHNPRLRLGFRLLTVVGIGSFLFHGTLTKEMQTLDEVPMLFSASILLHPLFEANYGLQGNWLLITQTVLFITTTAASTLTKGNLQAILFRCSFAILQISAVFLMIRLYLNQKNSRAAMKYLFKCGLFAYLFAFSLWITEQYACEYLNGGKDSFLPFNPQFHALWHILASFGAYYFGVFTIYAWMDSQGKKIQVEFFMKSIPYVQAIDKNNNNKKFFSKQQRFTNFRH